MRARYGRLFLIFLVLSGLLTACFTDVDIVAYCDHITVNFQDDGQGQVGYIFVFSEDNSSTPAGITEIDYPPQGGNPFSGSFDIQLDHTYPDGTKFEVYGVISLNSTPDHLGSDTCAAGGHHIHHGASWFEPGDSRLNRQAYAYAAVYCDDANSRVAIYGIHSQATDGEKAGQGFPAIFVPYDSLPATPSAEQGNVLIQQYQNIGFYRLTTGEYQVNAGPDSEGKTYVVTFDGCPSSIMHAYMMQNGVMTQTEVYPH